MKWAWLVVVAVACSGDKDETETGPTGDSAVTSGDTSQPAAALIGPTGWSDTGPDDTGVVSSVVPTPPAAPEPDRETSGPAQPAAR
ncbi:MAG: hypothetical protein AAF211_26220 [Myxococcota bacterium]